MNLKAAVSALEHRSLLSSAVDARPVPLRDSVRQAWLLASGLLIHYLRVLLVGLGIVILLPAIIVLAAWALVLPHAFGVPLCATPKSRGMRTAPARMRK